MPKLTPQDIKKLIPHRDPMLMVDTVEAYDIDEGTLVAKKTTHEDDFYFQGHFPNRPVMPGVLIGEALAQASAVFISLSDPTAADKIFYFLMIDKVRFRAPVTPGDTLTLHAKVLRRGGSVWRFYGEAKVNGKVVAQGELTSKVLDQEAA